MKAPSTKAQVSSFNGMRLKAEQWLVGPILTFLFILEA